MTTSNPVPSNDPTDLLFNAQKLDQVVNGSAQYYTDRLGVNRRTMEGISAAADVVFGGIGYAPPVTYAAGISLTLTTQTVEYAGEVYAPKLANLPFTTSGTFETAKFRLIQGVVASDIAASGGASMIGYMPVGTGAVATTVQTKLHESVSVFDFMTAEQVAGVKANTGTTDVTSALQAALASGKPLYFPQGIYSISAPLSLPEHSILWGHTAQFYPNFTTDWQTLVPSYAGKCAIIQYVEGVHGAIFTGGGGSSINGLCFRSGQIRSGDSVFQNTSGISMLRVENCTFQNLDHIASYNSGAWGAWFFENNQVTGMGTVFYGIMVDMRIIANVFTTCGATINTTTGAGFNTIIGNRFEWGSSGFSTYKGRGDIITGNLFDANATAGIILTFCQDFTISGNRFVRNGRTNTDTNNSHIRILSSNNIAITGNDFKAESGDTGGSSWPKYILEIESCPHASIKFIGNQSTYGYTEMPVVIRLGTSPKCLDFDSFEIPAGFRTPATTTDPFAYIAYTLGTANATVGKLFINDNRYVVGYFSAEGLQIVGKGDTPVALTNSSGALSSATYHNITYGGLQLKLVNSQQYATAQPDPWRSQGVFSCPVYNSVPAAGGYIGWVRTASGSPDTWKTFGAITP